MTNMDHSEAVRLQAAEKYVLGKLPKDEHAAYEEHYFDCASCAEEIKATVAFMECVRQVAQEEAAERVGSRTLVPAVASASTSARGSWLGWLRPAFAAPVLAALFVFITYQNSVTIPRLKEASSHSAAPEAVRYFSLLPAGARGEGSSSSIVKVGPQEDFSLDVDMPGNSPTGYLCQVQDESGRVRFTVLVSAEQAKNNVRINVPGGVLQPGKYKLVILSGQPSAAQTDLGNAAAKLPFTVEFLP